MNKWIAATGLLLGLGGTAMAGWRSPYLVQVDQPTRYAAGSLSSAHNSPDAQQYIGCMSQRTLTSSYAYCYANTAAGVAGSCSSNNPEMVRAVDSLPTDGTVQFYWDANGQCTYLSVRHDSFGDPKL